MGACRASCVDDSDFLFRSRRAENCAPYLFSRLALLGVFRTALRVDLPVGQKATSHDSTVGGRAKWFFITINCVPAGKNQLCRAETGDAVLATIKFNHERSIWHCRLCMLMPDHLHAIIAFPRKPGMQTAVRNWKKFVAGKHGVDWQRDFFGHRLRDLS
jgi:REP-associated tyrosine transposase